MKIFSISLMASLMAAPICAEPVAFELTNAGAYDIQTDSQRLKNLFDRFFEDTQRMNPEFATYLGITREYNAQWSDFSEEGFFNRNQMMQSYLDELLSIDLQTLTNEEGVSYQVLKKALDESLEEYQLKIRYMPLDHLSGVPFEIQQILDVMPVDTRQDYENILSRLDAIPKLLDQTLVLLDKGLNEGLTQPRIPLRSLPQGILNLISPDFKESVFFCPFLNYPVDFRPDECGDFSARAVRLIEKKVYPAYQKLYNYVANVYLPNCRDTISISDLPEGKRRYQFYINHHTTTSLTPEEIHACGLKEVERIRQEMKRIVDDLGFQGPFEEFFHYLNTNPDFYYDTSEDLLSGYRQIIQTINAKLPELFRRLPKLPCEVVPVPSYSEQTQIGAYYMPGSPSSGRPGRFFVNTYDLPTRPKWEMESLALHEAIPGHHFQITIAQENSKLPEFRKNLNFTAYVEGWALYAESLGGEIGLYQSPYSKFGRLVAEVWRAVRLVVDTGMHALGWTREEAIAYFKANTGVDGHDVITEIDRYLVWPGQALSYKIGELTIQKWRNEAKEALGDAFDIRQFHDILLEKGALPLDICEQQIQQWISAQQGAE